MSNFITPTIIQGSNRFNALNAFYIGFSGSGNRFTKCSIRILDIVIPHLSLNSILINLSKELNLLVINGTPSP